MNSIYGTPVAGMRGADFQLEVVADNIANLNTSGYQAVEPVLASLPAQAEIGDPNNGASVPSASQVGMGVRPSGTMRSQVEASLQPTGNPLDLALANGQFVGVRQPDGALAYTSQISLHLQPDGQVVGAQGLALVPPIAVKPGIMRIGYGDRGKIVGLTRSGKVVDVATLPVTTFAAPENLRSLGNGLYAESFGSGRPQAVAAGQARIASGYQLKSTVDLATEMVNMIQADRMYEANTKALQTLDALVNGAVSLQAR